MRDPVIETAFRAVPYACFVLNWDGTVNCMNRRAHKVYGPPGVKDERTMTGVPFSDFTHHSQEDIILLLQQGAPAGTVTFRMTQKRAAVGVPLVVFRLSLIHSDQAGTLLYMLTQDQLKSTAEALSKMNALRKEARDAMQRLEASNLELHQALVGIEAFSRGASHDLRTPINTLSGMLELFSAKYENALPEGARNYLDVMGRAVAQMTNLTDTFIAHAKSSQMPLTRDVVDIRPLMWQVCADLEVAIESSGAEIDMQGDSFTISAEPHLFQILAANLVGNALKYRAPDRPLRINIRFEPELGERGSLIIQDNGIGFEPGEADAIFQPFVRLNGDADGTGIGLSTCAEVCSRHDWTISGTGAKDQGATFTITF